MQGKVARRLSKIESLSRDDAAAGRLEANPKGRLSLRLMRRCSSSETLFSESPRRRALPEPQIQAAQTLRIEWERSKRFKSESGAQRHRVPVPAGAGGGVGGGSPGENRGCTRAQAGAGSDGS